MMDSGGSEREIYCSFLNVLILGGDRSIVLRESTSFVSARWIEKMPSWRKGRFHNLAPHSLSPMYIYHVRLAYIHAQTHQDPREIRRPAIRLVLANPEKWAVGSEGSSMNFHYQYQSHERTNRSFLCVLGGGASVTTTNFLAQILGSRIISLVQGLHIEAQVDGHT